MQTDIDALTSLVDDVFLLTRIEGGRLQLEREPLDLADCCDEAIEALAPIAHRRDVTVRLEVSTRVGVHGNAPALGRVLRNLLDNAIRHAPMASVVTVTVGEGGTARVRVSDEGDGFPEGFSPHAFDQWSRADESRSRTTGGSGLGLAIARGLVTAHGGRIWVDRPPGGHVTFDLTTGTHTAA
ncbi:MAG: HAMP domain-containing sensor histidine kinase [Microthrixaceae bacterium]